MPRVPELGIPKDARVIPLKVELLKMEAPETYVSSIAKKGTLYIKTELMPLSLDEPRRVGIMPAPRVVGPVSKNALTRVVLAFVPVTNAESRSNTPFRSPKLPEVMGEEGRFNEPVPSITKLPPDS